MPCVRVKNSDSLLFIATEEYEVLGEYLQIMKDADKQCTASHKTTHHIAVDNYIKGGSG